MIKDLLFSCKQWQKTYYFIVNNNKDLLLCSYDKKTMTKDLLFSCKQCQKTCYFAANNNKRLVTLLQTMLTNFFLMSSNQQKQTELAFLLQNKVLFLSTTIFIFSLSLSLKVCPTNSNQMSLTFWFASNGHWLKTAICHFEVFMYRKTCTYLLVKVKDLNVL